MKRGGIALVLALALAMAGCGSGSNSSSSSSNGNVNGNWTANLTDPNGNPVFAFTTSLVQNSDNSIVGANLNFTTATPCFGQGATETGGVGASGNFAGNVNAAFTLSIQSGAPGASGNNMLNLQGTLNNNTISGTWVLTGATSGCSGAGNFTMARIM